MYPNSANIALCPKLEARLKKNLLANNACCTIQSLRPRKLHPLFYPKHQNFGIEKNSFFWHFAGTVFHTLPKNAFFIKFAHFFAVVWGVKELFFSQNQRAYRSFSPKKTFCWLI